MGRYIFDNIYCISKIQNSKLDQVFQKFIEKVSVNDSENVIALDTSVSPVTEIKKLAIT